LLKDSIKPMHELFKTSSINHNMNYKTFV